MLSTITSWTRRRPILRLAVPSVVLAALVLTAGMVALSGPPARMPVRSKRARTDAASSTSPPPQVVVLGDSTALDLGYALQASAPPGTTVSDEALFGCGLAMATEARVEPAGPIYSMSPPCNPSSPPSQRWPAFDRKAVTFTAPGDVVLFLAGPWDIASLLVDGQWTNITKPSFRKEEAARIDRLIAIATAHGAHLDLLTMPCINSNWSTGQPPPPGQSQRRRRLYNGLLADAAAHHRRTVSLVNWGKILCPKGRFKFRLDGVQVRSSDGVHTPVYVAGNSLVSNAPRSVARKFYAWLSPRIWPLIDAAR
jgi:hypothetical protein